MLERVNTLKIGNEAYNHIQKSSLYLTLMKKRWKLTLGIIAGLLVVGLITWTSPTGRFILSGGLGLEERPFSSEEWKAVTDSEPSKRRVRMLMLDDLMTNRLKKGMDSVAVKEMLGEPDRQHGFSYDLGELAPGIDVVYLVLKFDSNGKVDDMEAKAQKELP